MKKLFVGLIAAFAMTAALAGEVGSYPTASALGGTERLLGDQGGVTRNMTPAQILTYVLAQGVPLTSLPTQASPTLLGNASGSTTTPTALNPLAVANMQSAVISVDFVANAPVTLSGIQTVDGVSVANGQFVFVAANTATTGCNVANSGCQNGVYVANTSGAWTRALNFPANYVIAQNCDLLIKIKLGNAFAGSTWYVPTAAGSITINTTGFTGSQVQEVASPTRVGKTLASSSGGLNPAAIVIGTATTDDCVMFNSTTGDVASVAGVSGLHGFCAQVATATNHLILTNDGLAAPTSSVGTMNANSTDHWGFITGLSAATTVTVTFVNAFPAVGGVQAASCTANDSAGTAVGVNYTLSTGSVTAAVFTMTALTGSLSFHCFGTQ